MLLDFVDAGDSTIGFEFAMYQIFWVVYGLKN